MYRCRCGCEFPESLGKYGCSNCCGDSGPAQLIEDDMTMIPAKAETVEMVDGRIYWSTDNWATVFVARPGGKSRRLTGRAADLARLLAISQAHGSASG